MISVNDHEAAVRELDQLVIAGLVPMKDFDFATGLVHQYFKKKFLSPKQWVWVETLIYSAVKGENTLANGKYVFKAYHVKRLIDELTHRKFVLGDKHNSKLFVEVSDDLTLMLYPAGPKSKYPGTLLVVDAKKGDGGFSLDHWHGRIMPDGSWSKPYYLTQELCEAIYNSISASLDLYVLATPLNLEEPWQ